MIIDVIKSDNVSVLLTLLTQQHVFCSIIMILHELAPETRIQLLLILNIVLVLVFTRFER